MKILGLLFGLLVLALLATAAWINFSPLPRFEAKTVDIQVPSDSATVAQGAKIVETLCISCHLGEDGKLSGRLFMKEGSDFGSWHSRNITQHPEKGIGRYSDGQIAYILRTGIKPNGEWAGPYMSFPRMSDQDLASIIAYLRSDSPLVQPSEATHPAPEPSFLLKALLKLGAFKPFEYEGKAIQAPPASDRIAYGRYLATAVYECYGCHSASFQTNNPMEPEKSAGYFGGGNPIEDDKFQVTPSANLTMSHANGLGKWTEEQFRMAVRAGMRPDQQVLKPRMPRFARLTDEEVGAIWAYLQTVPVIEKQVTASAE